MKREKETDPDRTSQYSCIKLTTQSADITSATCTVFVKTKGFCCLCQSRECSISIWDGMQCSHTHNSKCIYLHIYSNTSLFVRHSVDRCNFPLFQPNKKTHTHPDHISCLHDTIVFIYNVYVCSIDRHNDKTISKFFFFCLLLTGDQFVYIHILCFCTYTYTLFLLLTQQFLSTHSLWNDVRVIFWAPIFFNIPLVRISRTRNLFQFKCGQNWISTIFQFSIFCFNLPLCYGALFAVRLQFDIMKNVETPLIRHAHTCNMILFRIM